jgi:hypothetical protein
MMKANLKWVTNIRLYEPHNLPTQFKDRRYYWKSWEDYQAYMNCHVQGEPRGMPLASVEQLKSWGVIGLYRYAKETNVDSTGCGDNEEPQQAMVQGEQARELGHGGFDWQYQFLYDRPQHDEPNNVRDLTEKEFADLTGIFCNPGA